MDQTAEEKFQAELAENLKEAGQKNMLLTENTETARDQAMQNVAEAFTEPLKEFIDSESSLAAAGVKSTDGTVTVTEGTDSEGKHFADLSVQNEIDRATAAEQANAQAVQDNVLRIASGGSGEMIFYRGTLL